MTTNNKKFRVFFDLDGTLADFYGVDGWLDCLIAEQVYPYSVAKPLINFSLLARYIHKAQAAGVEVSIISWGSKEATDEYLNRIEEAKREWLAKHLPSVVFDEIHVVHYGTPKENFKRDGDILFDDEERNRSNWGEGAFAETDIFDFLRMI